MLKEKKMLPIAIPPFHTIGPIPTIVFLYGNDKEAADKWVCNNLLTFTYNPTYDGVEPSYVIVEPLFTDFHCSLLEYQTAVRGV